MLNGITRSTLLSWLLFFAINSNVLAQNPLVEAVNSISDNGWRPGPTTFGMGLNVGTLAGVSMFFSPLGKDIYTQLSANFNNDGDYNLFLDAAYPISSLFEDSRFWDAYVGLGFMGGDLHRFPIRLGSKNINLEKNELYFGLRVPIGIMYYIPNTPIQIGAEAAPSMVISPKALPHLNAAILSRVVFQF